MLPVLTPEQMREVDRFTIEEIGIAGRVLIEHAGRMLAQHLMLRLPEGGSVGIVCGKGNNGGDGFVTARFLHHAGYRVTVYHIIALDEYQDDAQACLQPLQRLNVPLVPMLAPEHVESEDFRQKDWLIDCVLGTGTKGGVRGHFGDVIERMNESGIPILSCDAPSGLDVSTGRVERAGVKATETLTIGLPKIGLLLYPGAEYVGALHLADIGFPREAVEHVKPTVFQIERNDAAALIPRRPKNGHKGTFGRALFVGGSRGMAGAITLAADAALRVGVGLVSVGTPESVSDVVQGKLSEATTVRLPETSKGSLHRNAEAAIRAAAAGKDALGIGPGLSQVGKTKTLIGKLLGNWSGMPAKVVFDADALNAVAPLGSSAVKFPPNAILTPHPGEMARLLDKTVAEVESDRIGVARQMAMQRNVVVVLKGVPTVVATPNGTCVLNTTGNSGMATGGSGDALTGVIVGLLAQGLQPFEAAILGVYLHGYAGDLAANLFGAGMIAGQIARFLPQALMELSEHTRDTNAI
ncbi:MAG: NAD(P)H-hydrate dehydratase [Candidatus Poribacteria bacterium]|nr:NAD(P)H-hydrate dehydratase [Candidatus Poribacteria bacterium]